MSRLVLSQGAQPLYAGGEILRENEDI